MAADGLEISLAQLKRQMVRDILHDARIFAAHRENSAPNPLLAAQQAQQNSRRNMALLTLTPADLSLASRKHSGSNWRPPPKQVINNIAEEINSHRLEPVTHAAHNQQ